LKKGTEIILGSLFISSLILSGGLTTTVKADSTDATQTTSSDKTGQIVNTVIFKDYISGKEIGRGTATGNTVGDVLTYKDLNYQQKPLDYYIKDISDKNITLKANGTTQTIQLLPDEKKSFYGVVKINNKSYGESLSTVNGKPIQVGAPNYLFGGTDNEEFPPKVNEGLEVGTEWKVYAISAVFDYEYYYRAGDNQWISSKDATLVSRTAITPENSVRKVTGNNTIWTKNSISYLTKFNGDAVKNRALAPKTPWYTDKTAIINGVTMYRVATNEWVKLSDITWNPSVN